MGMAAVGLVAIGILIGIVAKGDSTEHSASEALAANQIGSSTEGRRLFVDYKCAACHSFKGKGGSDAPALDFMTGKMTASDIADMSGRLWNHVPDMERFFREEKLAFPTFKGHQMADLVAYLHGGGPAPDVSGMKMHEEEGEGESGRMDGDRDKSGMGGDEKQSK